jgi:[acyl-carrier-protein] S-malonyltransferase
MYPIVAVFPGQGSQHVGMAKNLYENFSVVKESFEEASDAIHVNLKKLCFDGPESDLILTENTQPCLLVASVAAFRVAEQELNFTPHAVAGHSLGEYSALVAAKSLSLSTATKWVKARGAIMQIAVAPGEGGMAAILGLEDSAVFQLCEKATQEAKQKRKHAPNFHSSVEALAEPANFNAPGQVVIAGSQDGIQEAIALIKTDLAFKGAKAIPLQVSAPFHCQLMKPARDHMAEIFSQPLEAPKRPLYPYVPNRTARLSQEPGVIFELLIEQIDHPVLWKQSILMLLDAGLSTTIEFGAGKVLSGLIKRIATSVSKDCIQISMNDTDSLRNLESFLNTSKGAPS